jgi:hypothetical protein
MAYLVYKNVNIQTYKSEYKAKMKEGVAFRGGNVL